MHTISKTNIHQNLIPIWYLLSWGLTWTWLPFGLGMVACTAVEDNNGRAVFISWMINWYWSFFNWDWNPMHRPCNKLSFTCISPCERTCMACLYKHTKTHTCNIHMYVYTHIHTHVQACTHTHARTYTHYTTLYNTYLIQGPVYIPTRILSNILQGPTQCPHTKENKTHWYKNLKIHNTLYLKSGFLPVPSLNLFSAISLAAL